MNLEEKIQRSRVQLLIKHPFYAAIIMRRPLKADDRVPTAYTDGNCIGYNPEFFEQLTAEEISFVLAHEASHIARKHHLRRRHRHAMKWNVATDFQINLNLTEDGLTMPKMGLKDEHYEGMSSEAIYAQLPESDASKTPLDEIRDWPGGDGKEGSGHPTQADIEAEARKIDAEVITAHTMAKKRGSIPAGYDLLIDELKNPCVDWKYLLRQYIQASAKDDFTWRRPNRRFAWQNVYMPSLYSERIGELVVAVDTSGSTYHYQVQFVSEVRAIAEELRPSKLHLLWCDSKVYAETYDEPNDIPAFQPKGGGGTSFVPVFDWVRDNGVSPVCLVYLTDMYGEFPSEAPDYPVMWIDCSATEKAPFGDHIIIKE